MNRRAVIGGAVALPVLAVAATPAAAAVMPAPDRRWDRLVSAFTQADAAMTAAGDEQSAASRNWQNALKAIGDKPEPPTLVYPRSFEDMTLREIKALKHDPGEWARYEADLAAWEARRAEFKRSKVEQVNNRYDAAVDAQDQAARAIFDYPAPTTAALLYKLDLMERAYQGCDIDERVAKTVLADVRRHLRQDVRA